MTLAPAHWIRPNEVSRQPKVWVYLDTEATITRVGAVETQTWRCGVTCMDRRRRGYDDWHDPDWGEHTDAAQLWHWIDARTKVGERTVVVAHNLAYDLRVSQAFTWLPEFGWHLDRIRPDGEQTFCRWRNGRRTIVCVDSTSWVPGGLARIGADIGHPKRRLPAQSATMERWLDYCRSDVDLLRDVWRRIIGWLHDEDLGCWQPTGAAQAWAAWRHRHLTDKVLVGDDPDVRAMERDAMWAGRSEAWRHGTHRRGPYTEWDVESAYLRIMRDCDVPTRFLGRMERPPDRDVSDWLDVACVLSRITVTTDHPVVPTRGPKGIVWPVGTFETIVWDPELRLLRECDAKVEVHEAVVYSRANALGSFARWLWPIVTDDDLDIDPVVRRVAKHWSRAIVGRFGVRYHAWEPFGPAVTPGVGLCPVVDFQTGERTRLLTIGDRVLQETGMVEGDNAVPSILGWIMSETRARLWHTMQRAGLDNVLHVDTDGLLVNDVGNANLLERGNAGLRVKGEYKSVEVIAPRQVVYGGQLRAPGVPRRSRRVAPRTWEGSTWSRLSTELANGTPDRVQVKPRRVTLRGTDNRRLHNADGSTSAITMGDV